MSSASIRTLKISASNLKKLSLLLSRNYEVQIYCTKLHSIEYCGSPLDIHSEVLPFLSSAKIKYSPSSHIAHSICICRASKISNILQNVVTLKLNWFCIELLSRDWDLLSHLPTSCYNLRELFLNIIRTKNQVQFVIILLRSYPNLQDLFIKFSEEGDEILTGYNREGFHQSQEMSSEGALKHLRKVKIRYFEGRDCEFDLVKYLLAYGNVLESMVITYRRKLCIDAERRMSISEEFLHFTKSSSSVEISFLEECK